jgi:hypothetical protein
MIDHATRTDAMSDAPGGGTVRTLDSAFKDNAPVINLDYEKFLLSKEVARWILFLFGISTLAMIGLVVALSLIDVDLIEKHIVKPGERLITEAVIMSVIGATIVQVGAAAFAIVSSVFKVPATVIRPENAGEQP